MEVIPAIDLLGGKVVRLLPPLIISDAQAERIIDTVSSLVKSYLN